MKYVLNNPQAVLDDAKIKQNRVRNFLVEHDYDCVIITSREHFAWLTGGGDNHVIRNSSIGFASAVITQNHQYIVAHTMDADRIYNEQVIDQGYELIKLRWYDGDIRSKSDSLVNGKVASDTDFGGLPNVFGNLIDLHYPMTDLEIDRLRWLGKTTDNLFFQVAQSVKPGETEKDISTRFHCAHLENELEIDVLIVGSDDRCFLYRHPLPTDKPLEKYLMLHSVARRWGLHCNVTRFVHFGLPDQTIRTANNAASNMAARVILSLAPGIKFSKILSLQKKWYREEGFPDEWQNHFQGGLTGYIIVDGERCFTDNEIQVNQPYEWFMTVTGAKAGELVLLTSSGTEIISYVNSSWPGRLVKIQDLGELCLPDILIR